jgi:anti-sigma regulatory factor (Ser/Thr protein kinase)
MEQVLFEAKMEELPQMMAWARKHIIASGFTSHEARKIELALEEGLVNIIHYAYQDRGGLIDISFSSAPSQRISFILKDKGPPFNPLLQTKTESFQSLEEKKEGGLGILLMCHYMDEVRYERRSPYNILTLTKNMT